VTRTQRTYKNKDLFYRLAGTFCKEERSLAGADLASDDAVRGQHAVGILAVASKQAIAFLEKRLPPIEPVDAKRLDRLVADLNSNIFAVRERASAELEKLRERAEPALSKALVDAPSLEVRQRVQLLLEKFERANSVHWLRTQRTMQVFFRTGTVRSPPALPALRRSRGANIACFPHSD
jgi:hypothetical protein